MTLTGTAAIVTGGGSGLGAATVRALAAAGARVAVLDIDVAQARAVAAEVGGAAFACDVTSEAAAVAALDAAAAAHGVARVLVNCAGVADAGRVVGKNGPLPLATFARVIGVNLIGSFNMLRLFAARLIADGPAPADHGAEHGGERGVAINTASIAAYEGQVGQIAYAASKAGVVGMTLPAARDLAQHAIRVNTVAPGLFLTPLLENLSADFRAGLAANIPFPPRLGDPAEFASLVLHIIGNPMLNGETVRLDGALRMAPR